MELFDSLSSSWVLVIVALWLFYYFSVSTYDYWRSRGVPYVKPFPLFGNSLKTVLGISTSVEEQMSMYNAFPDSPYVGRYIFRSPMLMLKDPNLINTVLIQEFTSFYNRGINIDEKLDPLAQHLVNLRDRKWKILRNKLTPVFSSGKLKTMHHQLVYLSEAMAGFMEKYSDGQPLATRDVMARFTTDVIGHCAFGIRMNALDDKDSEFRKIGKQVFKASVASRMRTLIRQVAPQILTWLNWKGVSREQEQFFISVLNEAITSREKNNEEVKDFLQLLIDLKKEDEEKLKAGTLKLDDTNSEAILDDMLMAANSFVFFLAGFETTASTLGYFLFEMAQNIPIQNKLRGEIKSILAKYEGKPTFDAIKEMTYLDQCVNETLRKYPPVPGLPRECTREFEIPNSNIVMKKKDMVFIPVYSLHHDPKYYPDPDKYDPERFCDMTKIRKGTFLPFGDGPRICIGMRFARTEIKVLLATLLSKYEFLPHERTGSPLKFHPRATLLAPEGEIWLNVKKSISIL